MPRIDKLSHDNYIAWAFRMKMLLSEEEVWETIEGEVQHAPEIGATAVVKAEYEKYKKKQASALQWIVFSCADSQLVYVKGCKTGKEAWETLKETHSQPTLGSRIRIMKQLFKIELAENGSMREHIDKILNLLDKLNEMGSDIGNDVSVTILIGSLGKSYENVATAIEAWPEDRLKFKFVQQKLLEEYEKKQSSKETRKPDPHARSEWSKRTASYGEGSGKYGAANSKNADGGALVSDEGMEWKDDDAWAVREKICYQCHQPGHIRYFCPLNKRNDLRYKLSQKKEENKERESAKMARSHDWYLGVSKRGLVSGEISWLVDSGATSHMCNNEILFTHIDKNFSNKIFLGDGNHATSKGLGTIKIQLHNGMNVNLTNVLYVPNLAENLISVKRMTEKGLTVIFDEENCYVKDKEEISEVGKMSGGLYKLKILQEEKCAMVEMEEDFCVHEWHRRLAHRNLEDIKMLKKVGLKIATCNHNDICEECIQGKMARKPFPKRATPTDNLLDVVVSDVCGPMQVESIGRKRYYVSFIDLHSRYCEVYFIRKKDEVPKIAKDFLVKMRNQVGRWPKTFRSDRGLEYMNENLQGFLRSKGIKAECTVGYAPEQNGVAERKNRTLMEAARSMLNQAKMPKCFWAEAVNTANFTINRIAGMNKGELKSPFERIFDKKPNLLDMQEFGCKVYVMVPYEKRRKLDNKAERMKFVGYDDSSKGYRLVDKHNKILVSREVKFLNTCRNSTRAAEMENAEMEKSIERESMHVPSTKRLVELEEEEVEDDEESEVEEENHETLRRSTRSNFGNPPAYLENYVTYKADESRDPRNFKEAMESANKIEWKKAMELELETIEENNTWELTELPKGKQLVGSKWVFKTKHGSGENEGEVKHKARLVAQGFSQKFGVDYDEVFAPVARSVTFRLLLSIAGERNYKVQQYDVKSAFLNGILEEEIYLKPPPGSNVGNLVYRLRKSLYGLKQSARVWNQTLHETLEVYGCKQNSTDNCLYSWKEGDNVCYLLVHVDDILVAGNDETAMKNMMNFIGKRFDITNLGGARQYLGIDIQKDDGGRFMISQGKYIDEIVNEAGLKDAKVSKFPLDTGYSKLMGSLLPSNEKYRKLIGMLLYLTTNTRPDIAASVAILSKKVEKPRDVDMEELKRVVRYIKGTRDLKLIMNNGNEKLTAVSDANWAEDRADRKSNTGFVIFMNGGTVSWCCRKQDIVSLSSAESEYIALAETCKEVIWLRGVLKEMDTKQEEATTIHTDSQSCIAMIKNQRFSNKTKHIDVRYHFIRDQMEKKTINLSYVSTEENTADLMTKPLGGTKVEYHRKRMGLEQITT